MTDTSRAICDHADSLVEQGLPEPDAIEAACLESSASPSARRWARTLWGLRRSHWTGSLARMEDETPARHTKGKAGSQALPDHLRRDQRVQVRATASDVERVDAWADDHGLPRSTAIVTILRERLDADGY